MKTKRKKTTAKRTRERALEFQRQIKKWLEQRGWEVVNIPPVGRVFPDRKNPGKVIYVSLRNDIFGCDLIARKNFIIDYEEFQNVEGKELWIQATMDTGVKRKLTEIARHTFVDSHAIDTQIWLKTATGETNIKRVHKVRGLPKPGELEETDIGKIIRGKFYATEGVKYDF